MGTPLGSGHLRIRRGLWERKCLLGSRGEFCFLILQFSVSASQWDPHSCCRSQRSCLELRTQGCSAGMHCHRPPTATGGATWVCSRPAPSRLPETPALCTVPALTSCLPAGGCSISVGGIQVLGPGNLMISEVLVQHSSVYICAVSQSARNSDPTIAQGILLVQGEPQGPARECPGSPHPPREPG